MFDAWVLLVLRPNLIRLFGPFPEPLVFRKNSDSDKLQSGAIDH